MRVLGVGAAVLLAPLAWAATTTQCKTSSVEGYTCQLQFGSLQVNYAVNNGTLAVRLAYPSKKWLGWAVSTTGLMKNGDAVIVDASKGSIERYLLGEHVVGDARVTQDLTDTHFETTNGAIIASFRRKLAATGSTSLAVENGSNTFLYAIGFTAAFDGTVHQSKGSYSVSLAGIWNKVATSTPTPAPDSNSTPEPTPAPTAALTPAPTPLRTVNAGVSGGCATGDAAYPFSSSLSSQVELFWNVDEASQTVDIKLVYQGNGWVGFGPSPSGFMVGSTVVVGIPNVGVYEYDLEAQAPSGVVRAQVQDITDTSVDQTNGVTTVIFTRPLYPSGKLATPPSGAFDAVYAHGQSNTLAQHAANAASGFSLDFGTCDVSSKGPPYVTLRNAHGWLMASSFGFLLPLGAITARFGRRLDKSWWFTAHRTVQTLGLLGGLSGIAVGIVYTQKAYNGQHFNKSHNKYGLAIGALVFVQFLFALMRPHKVDAAAAAEAQAVAKAPIATALDYDDEVGQEAKSSVAVLARYTGDNDNNSSSEKIQQSKLRIAWEWLHFAIGWGIVVWSVVQVFSGLRILKGQISDSYKWAYVGISCAIAALALVLQLRVWCSRNARLRDR